jgi:hypothetical protein
MWHQVTERAMPPLVIVFLRQVSINCRAWRIDMTPTSYRIPVANSGEQVTASLAAQRSS